MKTTFVKTFLLFLSFVLVIAIYSCKSNQKSGTTTVFQNRSWVLKELNGKPVVISADAKPVVLNFGVNDFNGNGGCNNMNGLYVVKEDMIKIGSVMSTRMFCENAKYETDFFAMLQQCNKYRFATVKSGKIKKQQLLLLLDDKILAVFE